MIKTIQLAESKYLFPEYPNLEFEALLEGVSADALMRIATYLIGKDLYSKEEIPNEDIIHNWFSDSNRIFANQIIDRIKKIEKDHETYLKIVSTISCLKLLQLGLENKEKGLINSKTKEQSEIDLFLAMLVCNQNEDSAHTRDKEKIQEHFAYLLPTAVLFHMSFANYDIINFNIPEYAKCQTIKALFLFQYLDSVESGKKLLKRFYEYYNITRCAFSKY